MESLGSETMVMIRWSQMVSWFKPPFAERDNKQSMIDLRGISTNWFETSYVPLLGFLGYKLW